MPQKRSANRTNTLKPHTVDKLTGEGWRKVELNEIVERIASLIPLIDSTSEIQNRNRRTKRPYVKGVATLFEPQFTKEVVKYWPIEYDGELSFIDDEFPYPDSRETCDMVITDAKKESDFGQFEWAIEMKYLRLVGNNGNNNDYVMQKAISPFLKDRSLVHDIEKLKHATFSTRKAVIFYGFDYDEDSVEHANRMCEKIAESIGNSEFYVENPEELEKFLNDDLIPTPRNLGRVISSVSKHGDSYSLDSVTGVIDAFLRINRISSGEPVVANFSGLERHPCGRFGRVVGWEIK